MDTNQLRTKMKSALNFTREKASQAGEAARAGAAKATRAADDFMTFSKLKSHVRETNNQIQERLQTIGEMVYATHTGKPSDMTEMERLLCEIDGLKAALAEDEQAIAALRNLRNCPGCGTPNPAEHIYCEECGSPLWPDSNSPS